ncbi:hypothetical protein KZ813_15885 [Sphingomonas sp. RHCKR7]|uniref:hypothetical protein n=1 Tax=Sphingomonas folli TaxID=2862497 RepID=UPI001CA5C01A|nr:hypothetical protein [Sphingomonas folli]MBW6528322.1 hypothetical protein [Sphingomonas folli]
MSIKDVWGRWRDLTRFRLACEMALSSYRKSFMELPIRDVANTKIFDERGPTRFECGYDDFVDALTDETYLYKLLLTAHASLVEEFGRTIVADLLIRGIPRSAFGGLDKASPIHEAAEQYIMRCNVGSWGGAILNVVGRDWTIVPGGVGNVVHAFVARNIISHGAKAYNQTAINRLNGVAPGKFVFVSGTALALDRETFQQHLSRLRNFARVICGVPSKVTVAP